MANLTPKTINEFPSASSLGASDYVPVMSGSTTKKVVGSDIINTSGTGYCKMPDGTLIQWGLLTIAANSSYYEESFTIPFVSAPTITMTGNYSNENNVILSLASVQYTSFRAYRDTTSAYPMPVYWIAIGRWK